jgi:phosphonopyruvate decarboxylase
MQRYEAIKNIMALIKQDEIVIASNGMISREVYKAKDRPLNFYMLGSMGCALAIGIGIAYARPDLKVIVISGDGAALMSLGTFVLHKSLRLKNLEHYILDNNCHATTGGQPTCSNYIDFTMLAPNTYTFHISDEQGDAPRVPLTPKQITKRFMNAIPDYIV